MIRITERSQTATAVVLKVEGELLHEDAAVLAEEGGRWMQHGKELVLDFRWLQTIKPTGLELLQSWPQVRVMVDLEEGSVVRHLLEAHGLGNRIMEPPDPP
jgi:ABC-type transporter Mla MlaB component